MSEDSKAVFLSYASQDSEAAKRIADALRAAGVEVWFDQSELVGGDAWDTKIRKQIGSCALFVPIISASTQAREEGYFRLEWRLADKRTELMGKSKAFLLPVCIDDTHDADADVPDSFTAVQWTRLKGGETTPAFVARVQKLLGGGSENRGRRTEDGPENRKPKTENAKRPRWLIPAAIVAVLIAGALGQKFLQRSPAPAEAAPISNLKSQISNAAPTAPLDPKVAEARALIAKALPLHEDLDNNTRTDYELAEQLFKRAIELAPLDAEVWAHYSWFGNNYHGVALDRTPARLAQVKDAADRAYKLDPASDMAQFAWGNYYRREPAMLDQAVKVLREVAARNPNNGGMRRVLAIALTSQKHYDEALAEIDAILARDPKDSRTWQTRMGTLVAMHRPWAEVEAAIDAALAAKVTPRALLRKAMLLTDRGDMAEAADVLDRVPPAYRQEDRMVSVGVTVALAQRQPARVREILSTFPRDYMEEANFDQFNQPKAMALGYASWLEDKPDRARLEWQEALRVVEERLATRRTDARLHYLKVLLLAMTGREKEADAAYRVYGQITKLFTGRLRAQMDVWLGRQDQVLDGLEAMDFSPNSLAALRSEPALMPLWDNPRFVALKAKVAEPTAGSIIASVDDKSVAVLAFANLSDDKANEYFSDGISEELLNVLAKVPGLKVSARTSAFYFKGKQVPLVEIARQLGVAYIVEGSVRKAGDKVRITAQLIKAADGFHVWSETFTRDLKDIFAVQDEIAGLIAKNLELKMGMVAARPTIDLEAYQEYLAGRALFAKASNDDLRAAIGHFTKALAIEPKFTAAWVQLAGVHTQLGRWGGTPTLQAWPAARAAIDRAVALEPDSPDVLLALGWILRTADWDWRGAERAYRRAMELRPNHADTLSAAAVLFFNLGRKEEALRLGRQAIVLDPLNAATQIDLSLVFYMSQEWGEQEKLTRRAFQLAPTGVSYHGLLAFGLAGQRRFAEAEAEARIETDDVGRIYAFGIIAAMQGQGEAARRCRRELEELSRTRGDTADLQFGIADISALLGDKDQAFAALEKAVSSRDPSVAWFRNDFHLRPLESDPRWDALLRKVGLADDQLK